MSDDQVVRKIEFDAVSSIDKKFEIVSRLGEYDYPFLYDVSFTDNNGQKQTITIKFQNGVESETGINGVTMESLLVIIADRLKAFQNSKFACGENEQALMNVTDALDILNHRTRKRIERGVEGKNVV